MKKHTTKEIAYKLRQRAGEYPETETPDRRRSARARFRFDSLTISCLPSRAAVLAVAAKYEKAGPRFGYSLRRSH